MAKDDELDLYRLDDRLGRCVRALKSINQLALDASV